MKGLEGARELLNGLETFERLDLNMENNFFPVPLK
jgi:hypothetical protein